MKDMEKVKIFTDSCSDIPGKILDKYNIKMIPTPVNFGDEVYLDRETLSPKEFYKELNQTDEMPKTSRISPGVFVDEFQKALDEGYKVLSINFSSGLSGIFESAVVAKNTIGSSDIHIIDSKSASTGFGLSVLKAAKAIDEGTTLGKVIEEVVDSCAHMEHIFAVGSLEMLKRGGRISSSKAFIGNVLNIKPILHFQDGEILPLSKVRGKKRMMDYLIEMMEERGYKIKDQIIGINHSANPELARKMKAKIEKRFGVKEFFISEIGAAIGSHVGHDTVSVFFLNSKRVADIKVV